MGCSNSTAKQPDNKKAAAAQKPKPKPKPSAAPADEATHLSVASSASPPPPQPAAEEKKEEGATAEETAVADPAAEPAEPAVVAEAAKDAEEHEEAAKEAEEAPAPLVATAPVEEEEEQPAPQADRRGSAAPIHTEDQTQRVADPNSPYAGPGPAEAIPIDHVYRCFDEANGLLFRLVNDKRHQWAFYNDTTEYVMTISVTFGPESSVTPLDDTKATAVNAETGECTLVLDVPAGETKRFMRGEYNGFTTCYDAVPAEDYTSVLEAPHDAPIAEPMGFVETTASAVVEPENEANVPLSDVSDGGTRIHFMEQDTTKKEPEDIVKKRHEEA